MNKNILNTIEGLNYLSSLHDKFDFVNSSVSAWSIAEHIDHCLKVHNSIINSIAEEKSDKEVVPLKFIGRVVLLTTFIPRGNAKTPEKVAPNKKEKNQILTEIQDTKLSFQNLKESELEKKIFLNHPVFGSLNPKQWIRFLYIHQHHHIKIIRDILK